MELSELIESLGEEVAEALLRVANSQDAKRRKVSLALSRKFPSAYPYIQYMYDEIIIFEMGDKSYRMPYSISKDEVTFGEPSQVEMAWAGVKEDSSETIEAMGDLSPIVSVEEDEATKEPKILVKIASPGEGSMAEYPEDVLKRDGPKAWPKGSQMLWDHPTQEEEKARPVGSLRNLAAVFKTTPHWDDKGPKGKGLYVWVKPVNGFKDTIIQLAKEEAFGTSLRAFLEVHPSKRTASGKPIATRIVKGKTVDFVTKPGAGGAVAVFESAKDNTNNPGGEKSLSLKDSRPPVQEKKYMEITEEQYRELTEGLTRQKDLETRLSTQESQNTNHKLTIDSLKSQLREKAAIDLLRDNCKLGDKGRNYISKSLLKNLPVMESGELDVEKFKTNISDAEKEYRESFDIVAGRSGAAVIGVGESSTVPKDKPVVSVETINSRASKLMGIKGGK